MNGRRREQCSLLSALLVVSIVVVAAADGAERAPLAFDRGFESVWLAGIPEGTPYDGCVLALDVDPRARRNARVYTLCAGEGAPVLAFLRETAPGAISLLAAAGSGGSLEIWVGLEGALEIWRQADRGAAIEVVARLEDPRIGPILREEDRPDLDGDGSADFVQGHFEGFTGWRRAGATFVEIASVNIPPTATLVERRVAVRTPPLLAVDSESGNRFTSPQAQPGDRWRVHRVQTGDAGRAVDVCPAWIDLPEPLEVRSAAIAEGTPPRLIALAQPGDRMALLGEMSLVVAPLECRRSGRGTGFERTVPTKHANYSPGSLSMRDVTGDGLDDAVVLGTSGRFDADPFVTVLVRQKDGSFASRPITWKGDADDFGTMALYAWDADLDGDGRQDLAYLHDGSTLAVIPGLEPDGASVPLARKPARLVALPRDIDPFGKALIIVRGGDDRRLVYMGTRAKKGGKSETLLVTVPL